MQSESAFANAKTLFSVHDPGKLNLRMRNSGIRIAIGLCWLKLVGPRGPTQFQPALFGGPVAKRAQGRPESPCEGYLTPEVIRSRDVSSQEEN